MSYFKKFLLMCFISLIGAIIVNIIFIKTSITKYSYVMFDFGLIVAFIYASIIDIIETTSKGK